MKFIVWTSHSWVRLPSTVHIVCDNFCSRCPYWSIMAMSLSQECVTVQHPRACLMLYWAVLGQTVVERTVKTAPEECICRLIRAPLSTSHPSGRFNNATNDAVHLSCLQLIHCPPHRYHHIFIVCTCTLLSQSLVQKRAFISGLFGHAVSGSSDGKTAFSLNASRLTGERGSNLESQHWDLSAADLTIQRDET